VDQFSLSVAGKPAGWAIVEPATLSLFPDAEGTAKVRFQPPKMWDSTAGRVQFSIRAQSKAASGVAASQDGMLEIAPFASATAKPVPRTSRGSASADHRLVIENTGNAPLRATVEGSDPDELLAISVDRPMLVVQPGKWGGAGPGRAAHPADRGCPHPKLLNGFLLATQGHNLIALRARWTAHLGNVDASYRNMLSL